MLIPDGRIAFVSVKFPTQFSHAEIHSDLQHTAPHHILIVSVSYGGEPSLTVRFYVWIMS